MKFVKIQNRIINIENIAFIEKVKVEKVKVDDEPFNRIEFRYYLCFAGQGCLELTFEEYCDLEQILYKLSYGEGGEA